MSEFPTPYITDSPAPADCAIITLHGLGADGRDFMPVTSALRFAARGHCRFIFPNAPTRPVTINGGHRMPAWYDIYSATLDRQVDVAAVEESAAYIRELIDAECKRGIASERVVIAGFSQGGAVALAAALGCEKPLGGLVVMSSYFATEATQRCHRANSQLPILWQHGLADNIVPELLGRRGQAQLNERGYKVEYQTYAMAHSVCEPQIAAVDRWLGERLPPL